MKSPLINPKSLFSNDFSSITVAGINVPLFKKFTISIELGK